MFDFFKKNESEEKYKKIVQTSIDGFWVNDAEGNILDVNNAYCKMVGYTREELLKMKISDLEAKEDLEATKKHIKKIIETGGDRFETKHRRKDGEIVTIDASVTYSKNTGFIVFMRDVTRENEENEEKRKQTIFFNSIIENVPDMIFVKDAKNLKFELLNRAGEELLGTPEKDMIGKNDYDFFSKEQANFFTAKDKAVLNNKDLVDIPEEPIDTKSGKKFLHTKKIPIFDKSGNPLYLLGISEDITEKIKNAEKIKESQNKCSALYESSHDAIMTLEPPEWKFTSGNSAAVKMFNCKDEKEFTSLGPWQLSPEKQPDGQKSADKAKKMIEKAMEEGSNSFEWTHKRHKGEDFSATILLSRVEDGKPFLQATVRDISTEKKAAEALRQAKEYAENIIKFANVMIVTLDVEGNVVSLNKTGEDITGYSQDEILGKNWFETIVPQKKYPQVWQEFEKLKKDKTIKDTFENPILTKSGEERIISWKNSTMPNGLLSFGLDITERKRAEAKIVQFASATRKNLGHIIPTLQKMAMGDFSENIKIPKKEDEFTELLVALNLMIDDLKELKKEDNKREKNLENAKIAAQNILHDLRLEKETLADAEAKSEAILSSIGDGIIATGSDRKIMIMNKVAEKLLGWKIDEAIGRLYDEVVLLEDEKGNFVPPEKRPLHKAFEQGTTTTTTTTAKLYLLSKNNIKFPVAITVSPIILDNKIIGAIEVFRDVTREQELSQAKDDFLSIAAHDLRTPMSGIRANAEMILAGDYGAVPSRFKIPLEDIENSNLNLLKMVNDFLTLSRIEKGKIKITPEPVDLVPILDTIVRIMKPKIEELSLKFYNLKFSAKIPAKLPLVLADGDKIPEVIINLIDNAMKFTNKGSISLSVSIKNDSVVVAIKDTGIGIAKERQKDLFQKYTQVGARERLAYGKGTGLGLGLYISRLIIEGCGGKIWVESEIDKGSTFYFSLPLAKI